MTWIENINSQAMLLAPYFATTLTISLALLLDKILGEARKYHYLVGFGWLVDKVESVLNHDNKKQNSHSKTYSLKIILFGLFSWCLLVLPLPIIYFLFMNDLVWYWQIILDASVLYLAIGLNSLHQHAMQIHTPLTLDNLTKARHFTGYIVSRETNALSSQEMSRATVESMLENGHDSVIASMIYYIIGGAPLVILHRFANTLDAMWGYKNPRFNSFGYASAKLDDLLGFFSGKCCTLLYSLQGDVKQSFINAYQQGNQYKSHNGGWVMAAGATVMKITLGGNAFYHGKVITSPTLGLGNAVSIEDIPRSIALVKRATVTLALLTFFYQLTCYIL
jgi:adenosylcobinamide-phosphate synthase